jgi:hypothetical protein
MIYHGHIENGHVVLDVPVTLPDGALVSVHIQGATEEIDKTATLRGYFGSVRSGDSRSADNVRIDKDLAHTYGSNT